MSLWTARQESFNNPLTSSFTDISETATVNGAWEIELQPGESTALVIEFKPKLSATENCQFAILRGTKDDTGNVYDSIDHVDIFEMNFDQSLTKFLYVSGCSIFKIQARLVDIDGSAGFDDVNDSTIKVYIQKDGITAA